MKVRVRFDTSMSEDGPCIVPVVVDYEQEYGKLLEEYQRIMTELREAYGSFMDVDEEKCVIYVNVTKVSVDEKGNMKYHGEIRPLPPKVCERLRYIRNRCKELGEQEEQVFEKIWEKLRDIELVIDLGGENNG